jgi:fructokinase
LKDVDMRGRPVVTDNAPALVGAIEGGGTKFICAVGHSPTVVLDRVTIPTTDPVNTLTACVRFFEQMARQHGRISALGLACFGPAQLRSDAADFGCMLSTPKPGWSQARLVSPLEDALDLPVVLNTDVGAAAEAEWRLGSGRGLGSLAYVTVGTGIGGAVAPLHSEQRLTHPEMGHIPVTRDSRDRDFTGACPFHGDCLEGLACGPAIRARWGCDLSSLPREHPGRSIIAGYLGQLVTSIALLHGVDRIAIGGGVMTDGSLLPLIRKAAHGYLNGYLQPLRELAQVDAYLARPALGNDAAIAGALLQALDLLSA